MRCFKCSHQSAHELEGGALGGEVEELGRPLEAIEIGAYLQFLRYYARFRA